MLVLNGILFVFVALSILLAAYTGGMNALTLGLINSARDAAQIAIGLIGVMAFFLGLMKIAEDGGLLRTLSRAVSPVMRLLFPSIPRDHPAMSAMLLNIVSNMLGLANAATPFGIKAMYELDRLNTRKGVATDAMIVFLAVNTSGLAILPSGVMSVRATLNSTDPAGIMPTTWFATACATVVGVTAAFILSRLPWFRRTAPEVGEEGGEPIGETVETTIETPDAADGNERVGKPPRFGTAVGLILGGAYLVAVVLFLSGNGDAGPFEDRIRDLLSFWIMPALVLGLIVFGWARGVRVYDSLVEGAKEGFRVAKKIIPYLVAILAMVGMFRASGGVQILTDWFSRFTEPLGLPAEALPMAMMRPLSGSGALGVMTEIMTAHGPDSYIGYLVSTMQGSTETTFYVLAVYFGAVGIKKTRHALPACLAADAAGLTAAVFIVHLLFG